MAKNKVVRVREFFKFTSEELYRGLKTNHIVRFDDGDLFLTSREIIFNRFIWDIFKYFEEKLGKKTFISTQFSVTEYYTNGSFTQDSITILLENIFKYTVDLFCRETFNREILNNYLFEKLYDIYNDIYNVVICNSLDYSASIDIIDFLEIQFKDPILKSLINLNDNYTEEDIAHAYKTVDEVIMNDKTLDQNPLVGMYRSKSLNRSQMQQIVGPRGNIPDLNSTIFKDPVKSSFTLGLRSLYELAVESRTAVGSLYVAHRAIGDSEYLARSMQLVTMRMERLIDGDCGNKDYIDWYIPENPIIGKSELPLLVGKRYLNEETGKEDVIKITDTHLIGKTIKIRSILNCKCGHPSHVCVACMGDLAYSVPYPTNLGHWASTRITEDTTQGLLSRKHKTDSSKGIDFELGHDESMFFKKSDPNKDGHGLKFNIKSFQPEKLKYELIVSQDIAKGLSGLESTIDIGRLSPNKISKIDEVLFRITDKAGDYKFYRLNIAFSKSFKQVKETDLMNLSKASKVHGYFTTEFLNYIVGGEDEIPKCKIENGDDSYVIELNDWIKGPDNGKRFIEFPNLEHNFMQLTKEFKEVMSKLAKDSSPMKMLQDMFDLLNVKLDVNIALIEIVVSAFIVKDRNGKDVHLGRGLNNETMSISGIINNGSIAGICAFERHKTHLLTPKTFNGHNLVDHTMDVMIKPQETMEQVWQGKRL